MKNIIYILSLAIFLTATISICKADYKLIVGIKMAGYFDAFDMNRDGNLQLPQVRNHFPANTEFGDATDPLSVSTTGKFILFSNFTASDGLIYETDQDNNLQFLQQLGHSSGGGGFSLDDQYFIISKFAPDFVWPVPESTNILVYKWNNAKFDVVTTGSVPTSASLTFTIVSTSRNEFFGSTRNGYLYSKSGGALYQLNRETNRLQLRQYWNPWISGVDACAINKDGNIIIFGGRQQTATYDKKIVSALVRQPTGEWKQAPIFQDPAWINQDCGVAGIAITPDQYYAVIFFRYPDDPGGIWILNINNDGTLSTQSHLAFQEGQQMAMSPDGKYIAVAWNYAKTLSIVRLYSNGNLEEVDRISGPAIGCMAFLPQCLPVPVTAADDDCALYDGSRSGNGRQNGDGNKSGEAQTTPAKKSKPSAKPANPAQNGEWKRLEIEDCKKE